MKLYDGGLLALLVFGLFGWGVSVLERSSNDAGEFTKESAKEVVDHDIDYVTDHLKDFYAESKILYPDGYNQAWYNANVNH